MPEADRRFSYKEMVNCLIREIGFRQRVYPKWVTEKRMKADEAAFQIDCMKAALDEIGSLEAVEFYNRTQVKVEPEGDNFVVTGAFNGFSAHNMVIAPDDLRELLEQHNASAKLIDRLLSKKAA